MYFQRRGLRPAAQAFFCLLRSVSSTSTLALPSADASLLGVCLFFLILPLRSILTSFISPFLFCILIFLLFLSSFIPSFFCPLFVLSSLGRLPVCLVQPFVPRPYFRFFSSSCRPFLLLLLISSRRDRPPLRPQIPFYRSASVAPFSFVCGPLDAFPATPVSS